MAEDLAIPAPDSSAEIPRVAPVGEPASRSTHARRFGVAYAVLAMLAGLAIGAFVVLVDRPDEAATRWSDWRPTEKGIARYSEIAEHVSQRYRLQSGAQLVGVIASEPSIQNIDVGHFLLAYGSGVDDLKVFPAEDSISYQLCGLGQRCAIREGAATPQRARLLHRQALELALYSFRYQDDLDSVVAFMPPRAGQNATFALFFRRSDVQKVLEKPLHATLPDTGPLTPEQS